MMHLKFSRFSDICKYFMVNNLSETKKIKKKEKQDE